MYVADEPIYCNLIDDDNDVDLDSRLERLRITATGPCEEKNSQKVSDIPVNYPVVNRNDILTTIDEINTLDLEQELIAKGKELEDIGNRSYNSRQLEAQFSPNNLRFQAYKFLKHWEQTSSSPRTLYDSSSIDTHSSIRSEKSSMKNEKTSEKEKSVKNYGRVKSWGLSFDNLLNDPIGVKIYTQFLGQEYSDENINFWLSCEKFKKLSKKSETKKEAKAMYEKYLSINGAQPVNVDSLAKTSVQRLLSKPTKELFNEPQAQVYTLMKNDSYKRFLVSELYEKCLNSEKTGKPLPVCSIDESQSTTKNVPSYLSNSSSASTSSSKRRKSLSNWVLRKTLKI